MEGSADEALIDGVITHTVSILRVQGGMRKKALAELQHLEGAIVGKLVNSSNHSNIKTKRFQRLLKETRATISATYKTIIKDQIPDLDAVADAERIQTTNLINSAIGVDVVKGPLLSHNQLGAVVNDRVVKGHKSADWWRGQSRDLQNRFDREMREGVLLGEDVRTLANRVRGTKANGFQDGIMKAKKHEAEALVRSSVQTISNQARLDGYEENADLIKGIKWVATLDSRTTHLCKGFDGKIWLYPDLKPSGHNKAFPGPVAHWQCRSTQVPVMRSWDELSGKKLKVLKGRDLREAIERTLKAQGKDDDFIKAAVEKTRASMDGQVSAKITFGGWLKRKAAKDPKFPEKVLGKGRAELWAAGKITMTDLTDQNGRELTLKQLRAAVEANTLPGDPTPPTFTPVSVGVLTAIQREVINKEVAAGILKAEKAELEEAKAAIKKLAREGSPTESKFAGRAIKAGEPMTPETLGKIKGKAELEHENRRRAAIISQAKKRFIDGKPFTPGQTSYLAKLDKEERAEIYADWNPQKERAEQLRDLIVTAKLLKAENEQLKKAAKKSKE